MIENKEFIKNTMIYTCQSFYIASKKLLTSINKDITDSCDEIPCAVNCAFTSELALKSLLLHYNIDYQKEHYLDRLLILLPQDLIVNIIYYLWKNFYKDFDSQYVIDKIFSISEYFVKVRYIAEYEQVVSLYDMHSFLETIYKFFQCEVGTIKLVHTETLQEDSDKYKEIDKLLYNTEQKVIKERKNKLIKK